MSKTIIILNGPNLNLLGQRQPEIYGAQSLADIEAGCAALVKARGYALTFKQSNHEGELVDWIHEARENTAGLMINAGALTHTSAALYDALLAYEPPVIELHISNTHRREAFRHLSFISPAATAIVAGFGPKGYELALSGLIDLIEGAHA